MKIFVGCSSHDDIDVIYKENADRLGEYLASCNNDLIVGGISGLMGRMINKFYNYKRDVSVVCVKNYYDDISNTYNKYVCDTINDRKNYIISKADVFLFLPGGIGTFDEIFNLIEAKRAKQHSKPIIIVDIDGYFDRLKGIFDNIYKEKFSSISDQKLYNIFDDLEDVFKFLEGSDISE